MKLIIEIDDKDYELAKADKVSCGYQCRHIMVAVKNGTPYNPSGDAISREALKDEVIKHAEYYADRTKEDRYNVGYTECACEILDFIDNAQAVEPKRPQCNQITWEQGYEAGLAQGKHDRPQGEWLEYNATGKKQYMCSVCSMKEKNPKIARYCYWCGAKMKGGDNE